MANMQHQRGLTLIELLVVFALVAILSAIALPAYGRMLAGWRLDAAARQVVLDLGVARLRAIAESTGHRLRFPTPAAAYGHEREDDTGRYAPLGRPRALPEGVQIVRCTARGSAVTFRPRGQASTFGTITLRAASGGERRVIVDIAGRARIE